MQRLSFRSGTPSAVSFFLRVHGRISKTDRGLVVTVLVIDTALAIGSVTLVQMSGIAEGTTSLLSDNPPAQVPYAIATIVIFYVLGVPRKIWRHTESRDISDLVAATGVVVAVGALLRIAMTGAPPSFAPLDLIHLAMVWMTFLALASSTRIYWASLLCLQPTTDPDARAPVPVLVAGRRLGGPFLASQRSNPAEDTLSLRWRILQTLSFFASRAIVFQTERARLAAPAGFVAKGVVIPSIVRPSIGRGPDHASKVFFGVGRVVRTKGIDILLRGFATVRQRAPDWRLRIHGRGPERERLEQLSQALGVAGRGTAQLCGVSERPLGEMAGTSIFVLASRIEGFPNVLCEAMANGFPAIASDCNFGPSEIFEPGVNGLLDKKEDPDALAGALCRLIQHRDLREAPGNRAHAIAEVYSPPPSPPAGRRSWRIA
jgi:glycosyltransferase involved in cell wall biosynthesis